MTTTRSEPSTAVPPTAPARAAGRSLLRRTLDTAWAGPATTVVLTLLATVQALELWRWRPGVPLSLSGDATPVMLQVRTTMDAGVFAATTRVGAPFGMNVAWFTTGDLLNYGGIRLLGLTGWSPATVAALFFVAQFPLAALTAYWLARQLRLVRPAAVVVGVLFAVLPGHQEWFAHLWLSAYWMVPLGLWLALCVARGERPWPTRAQLRDVGPAGRQARWTLTGLLLVALAVGLADVYWVAFTLILLAAALVLRLATGTGLFRLLPEVALTATVATLCGLSLAVAALGRGDDLVTGALPAQRVIGESEIYAGKLIELVLPWWDHRLAPLSFLTRAYGTATTPSVERPALGLVALLGIVGLLGLTVARVARGRREHPVPGLLAAATLVCLAFYVRGGLGSLFALFITPQLRTWSRFVVFIGLLGLLGVGWWLSQASRRRSRGWAWSAAAVLCVVGVVDQTSPGAAPQYSSLGREQAELTAFGTTLQRAVGNCPVFQLPVVSYPEEPPPGRMGDYDHLLPSNAAPAGLTWSYGAIRGTSRADWQLALPVDRPAALVQDLADAGFCAVEVDHDGYAEADDPSSDLTGLLGAPVAKAPGQHLAAYDLTDLTPNRARRDVVLRPVVASARGSLVDTTGPTPFQWTGPRTQVVVSNLGNRVVPVTVSFHLRGNGDTPRTVVVRAAGTTAQRLSVGPDIDQVVRLDLRLAPGTTEVQVQASGDAVVVAGSEGVDRAAMRLSDLRVEADMVNAASLQQFAAASPRSLR